MFVRCQGNYCSRTPPTHHRMLYARHSKPFNPLLGETYELVRPDLGYCLLVEQVREKEGEGGEILMHI